MHKKLKTILSIFVVILVAIFLHSTRVLLPLEELAMNVLGYTTEPVYNTSNNGHTFANKDDLAASATYSQELYENSIVDAARLLLLEEENRELREQHEFILTSQYPAIGADVIGRTLDPLATAIRINKGHADGVSIGNPVYVGKGILIGKVFDVNKHSSYVRLITDNNSSIGAMVMNGDTSTGLVEGGYGLGVRMNFIPQNEIVTPGDVIVSSGLSEGMPRGLVIGTVELIEKQPHEPFQQAVITPIADFSTLSVVTIINYPTFSDS